MSEERLKAETDVEFFVAGGPGGQHRNKTATGVRLKHKPTGLIVTATERRSQLQNLSIAFERLELKLKKLFARQKKRVDTKPTRGSRERRLQSKKKRAVIKSGRGQKRWD